MAALKSSQVRTTLLPFKIEGKIAVVDCFDCQRFLDSRNFQFQENNKCNRYYTQY
jgi:hypothetical protein